MIYLPETSVSADSVDYSVVYVSGKTFAAVSKQLTEHLDSVGHLVENGLILFLNTEAATDTVTLCQHQRRDN